MPGVERVQGRLSVHVRGFGFLEHGDGSEFVPPRELEGFLAGDVVSAEQVEGRDGRTAAADLQLVSRWRTELFGTVGRRRGKLVLEVDPRIGNSAWPLKKAPRTVREGDRAVARLKDGVVQFSRVVAAEEVARTSVLVNWGIRPDYPDAVVKAAKKARVAPAQRRDLRDVPTVTIDGPKTRDIDDALAVLPPQADGAVRVLVSIADVDAVVPQGSPIDLEALRRGTSVYLPDGVIPMIPPELSEGALSLLEGQERAVLTVELRVDPEGRVTAVDVYEALIKNHARLTYDGVARFLDRGDGAEVPKGVRETVRWLRTAAARLGVRRSGRGGVKTFSTPELAVVFDRESGEPVEVERQQQNCAHELIERLMVAANEAVATWLRDRGLPGLYRVMPEPEPERVLELAEVAQHFGFEAGFGRRLTPAGLAAFEGQFQTSEVAPAMRTVVRRALGRALYSSTPSSHFALAAPLYLHFTSPIRRYPDLVVHRFVKAHLHGARDQDPTDPGLEGLADQLGEAAYRAAKAEDERQRMLVARLFAGRIGEAFASNIIAVKGFGVVVQLAGSGVTGTVASDLLPGKPLRFQAATHEWVGDGVRYRIGDALEVEVVAADEGLGRLEFGPRA